MVDGLASYVLDLYLQVSEAEKSELCEPALGFILPSIEYYRVPFLLVSDLVRTRKVYLRCGFAYITSEDLISVILTSYRSELAQNLAVCHIKLHIFIS